MEIPEQPWYPIENNSGRLDKSACLTRLAVGPFDICIPYETPLKEIGLYLKLFGEQLMKENPYD